MTIDQDLWLLAFDLEFGKENNDQTISELLELEVSLVEFIVRACVLIHPQYESVVPAPGVNFRANKKYFQISNTILDISFGKCQIVEKPNH